MKRKLSAVLLGAAFFVPALATAQAADPAGNLNDRYFSTDNPVLTQQEREALAIAQRFNADTAGGIRPFAGRNGAVQFVYGGKQASVVCAVLQVCDVALQAGEQVNSIQLGDTARWNVEPAISGVGAGEVQHLLIKPMDVGLETSLVVTTDRRTYHVRLRSHRTEYMPQVAFVYPDETLAKWDTIRRREVKQREENTIPATGEYLGNLSFDYDVTGSAPWKPLRVYNDGVKTIIEMPPAMQQTEAPTLLVVRKDGSLFTDAETVMVNYRVQGDRYIVDTVFDKAILISGVGRSQDKITVTWRK
jgi:type IV secretion system protein VirB9